MQPTTRRSVPVVTTDGTGVVSHAGTVLLAELADRIGLTAALSEATDGLRARRAGHDPGRVLVDVAVAIADGAVTITDVQVLADQEGLHGPAGSVASTPTIWRVLAGIDEATVVVASQAIFAGPQDISVRAMTPQASGRGYGHLCLRVGRVLVDLEDRDALAAWHAALEQAEVLADAAFGPELPPAPYEPRGRV